MRQAFATTRPRLKSGESGWFGMPAPAQTGRRRKACGRGTDSAWNVQLCVNVFFFFFFDAIHRGMATIMPARRRRHQAPRVQTEVWLVVPRGVTVRDSSRRLLVRVEMRPCNAVHVKHACGTGCVRRGRGAACHGEAGVVVCARVKRARVAAGRQRGDVCV